MPNNTDNDEILRKAVRDRDWKTIRELFAAGFEDKEGRTLLMYAAACNLDLSIIKELIAAGADINAKDREGKTILILAKERKYNSKIISKMLIDAGAK